MASNKESNISKFPEKSTKKSEGKHKGLYIFSVVVLIIIAITFIGGPALTSIGSGRYNGQLVFGTYRGEAIRYKTGNYFARKIRELEQQYNEQLQNSQNDVRMQIFQVWRAAFDQTVLHMAIMDKAEESGLPVSEAMVDKAIASNPQFLENQRFSPDLYNRLTTQQKFTLREFTRENLLHELYLQDVMGYIRGGTAESQFFAEMAQPKRKISYVAFMHSDFPRSEATSFIEENTELFSFIGAATITLPIEEYSLNDAERIRERIVNEEITFADAARDYSSDIFAELGGNAGDLYYYDLIPDFADEEPLKTVFSLQNGEISPVVTSNFAHVIYKVHTAARQGQSNNDETIDKALEYLNNFQRGYIVDYFLDRAENFAQQARQIGFSQAASRAGISKNETDFFAINYGSLPFFAAVPRGGSLGNSADTNKQFFQAAFGTPLQGVSDPVSLSDRVLVIVPIAEEAVDEEMYQRLEEYYPDFVRTATGRNMENMLIDSSQLVDNFVDTLFTYVISPEG